MVQFLHWPALGGSLLAAVAVGVHLGESTINLINPAHFQGPAIHPRDRGVALDPERLVARGSAFASLYGWEEGRQALVADCGDCRALRARDAFARPVTIYRASAGTLTDATGDGELARLEAEVETQRRAPELPMPDEQDVVLRYTDFPVALPSATPSDAAKD